MTARTITAALGGKWHGRYGMARCPCHEDGTPSLSIADGADGRLLVHDFGGCDYRDVLAEIRRRVPLDDDRRHRDSTPWQRHPAPVPMLQQDDRSANAIRIWQAARFAQPGTPVGRYVVRRGMRASTITHDAIRYVPRQKHFDTETRVTTYWPAMVALFLSARDLPVAIHRTWLTEAGEKAPVSPSRKMLGPVAGAAIRLTDAGAILPPGAERRLIIGEGIETMMALIDSDVGGAPTDLWHDGPNPNAADIWATGSTSGLRSLILPAAWRWRVVIAADNDTNGAGQKAAEDLAARLRTDGHAAHIVASSGAGTDFNDMLRGSP